MGEKRLFRSMVIATALGILAYSATAHPVAPASTAQEIKKLDIAKLMKATPAQTDAIIGVKRSGGTWSFTPDPSKVYPLLSFPSMSISQLEKLLGKGKLTYAQYSLSSDPRRPASVAISFASPVNSYVQLVGRESWKAVCTMYGIPTDGIGVKRGEVDASNMKDYTLRMPGDLAAFDAQAYEIIYGDDNGVHTEARVTFTRRAEPVPKNNAGTAVKAPACWVSLSYDGGNLSNVTISFLKVLTPEQLSKQVGLTFGATGKTQTYSPTYKSTPVELVGEEAKGWKATIGQEKSSTSLSLQRAQEAAGRAEGTLVEGGEVAGAPTKFSLTAAQRAMWAPFFAAVDQGEYSKAGPMLDGLKRQLGGDEWAKPLEIAAQWLLSSTEKSIVSLPADVKTFRLASAEAASQEVGWGKFLRNRVPYSAGRSSFLVVGGLLFENGLYAHSPSEISFDLGGRWSEFTTQCGVQDEMIGTVRFKVLGDGKELGTTSLQRGASIQTIRVAVNGVKRLTLIAEDGGDGKTGDWAVWADPTLTR